MDKKMILETVKAILCEKLSVTREEIEDESTIESLGADSLDAVEISMEFEEEFEITIEDQEFEEVNTVQEIVDLIDKKLQGKK